MIGKLRGVVDEQDADSVILDVGGVGYVVAASARTLDRLPARGETVTLVIVTHVREDAIQLFGFAERAERAWFNLLCTVQGVSVRHALAILSVLSPDALTEAVAAQDKRALIRANGVGPKLAGRVVSELKDKAPDMPAGPGASTANASADAAARASGTDSGSGVNEEAVSALVNLGYTRGEAFRAVAGAARRLGDGASFDSLVPEALRELAQ